MFLAFTVGNVSVVPLFGQVKVSFQRHGPVSVLHSDGDGKSYNSERAGAKRGPLRPCPHCNLVWYCCDDHYEIHHSADGRGRCFPFVIKRTQDKGR